MHDLFSSPWSTLERAKHHIRDLERRLKPLMNDDGWSHVIEKDIDGITEIHKIRLVEPLASDLPNILFDAANNLRAALDQAGFAAALAAQKVDPKRAYFPFAESEAELSNVVARKCADLPPEILALFRSFQPYKGGDPFLWALNKLCNTKKHCTLVPINVGNFRLAYMVIHDGSRRLDPPPLAWERGKQEIEILRTKPGMKLEGKINFRFGVSIDDIDIIRGKPALGILDGTAAVVERVLMATEAECRRIFG